MSRCRPRFAPQRPWRREPHERWCPIPKCIFLLGPDEWDERVATTARGRTSRYATDGRIPLTPNGLRLQLAEAIRLDSGRARRALVMGRDERAPGEDDADFFRRLELANRVDAYFVILPLRAKVLGTVFEGGMLRRDFHHGLSPRIFLFLERGIAEVDPQGRWTFKEKGKRTRYLESLAVRSEHIAVWADVGDLFDQVLRWAAVDD